MKYKAGDFLIVKSSFKSDGNIFHGEDILRVVTCIDDYENGYVMEPKSPEKDGYIFKNWELNGKEFDFQTPITENIVLTAKWEENTDLEVKSYSVI